MLVVPWEASVRTLLEWDDVDAWRRSTRCESSACVEVRRVDGGVQVRDSKAPDREPLVFDMNEWKAFVAGVRSGEFEFADPLPQV